MSRFLSLPSQIQKVSQFHTSSSCCNKFVKARQLGRAMQKLMMSPTKKRRNTLSEEMPTAKGFSKGVHEGKKSGNSRRASVLNKLFMQYITDLMATGENSSEFLGRGIEISKVQITPDYKGLYVLWVAKGDETDDIVEEILERNSGPLRSELSQLRLIGEIPMIRFVRDKQYSSMVDLENRLKKADYGEDFVPTEPAARLKNQLQLFTPLADSIKQKLQELETQNNEEELEFPEESVPPMPQNVLGLNHHDILTRMQKLVKKSHALHRLQGNGEESPSYPETINENPVSAQRDQFRQFLQQRKILREKARKEEKNYFPDLQFIKEEMQEKYEAQFQNMMEQFDSLERDREIEEFVSRDESESNK